MAVTRHEEFLRLATLGLLVQAYHHEQQWRERFFRLDALTRDLARDLGALKAWTMNPLTPEGKRRLEGHDAVRPRR